MISNKKNYIQISSNNEYSNKFYIGLLKTQWVVASPSENFNLDKYVATIISYFILESSGKRNIINAEKFQNRGKDFFRFNQEIDITDMSFYYLIIKIAFNSLAFLIGHENVLSKCFDKIRLDIVHQKNVDDYIISPHGLDDLFDKKTQMSNNEHYTFVKAVKNKVYAYVGLYDEWYGYLIITDEYNGEPFYKEFICDWKNKKEYDINHNFI